VSSPPLRTKRLSDLDGAELWYLSGFCNVPQAWDDRVLGEDACSIFVLKGSLPGQQSYSGRNQQCGDPTPPVNFLV